jgi:phosphoribosyl 1,2-cyclic phosphodiesterase
MRITVLASGSRGNATLIEAGGTTVLVDAGLAPKELRARAEAARGRPLERIDALVLTHAHGDHVAHAKAIGDAFDAPTWLTEATRRAHGVTTGAHTRVFGPRAPFRVGAIELSPHPVPHDAPQVALVFAHGEARAALVTDLGFVRADLLAHLRGVGTLLIEANHCPNLLQWGPYPQEIKRRIASGAGHLSNAQTAEALEALAGQLDTVVLMHLSSANNEPHLAREAADRALARSRGRTRSSVAAQDTTLEIEARGPRGQLALGL